MGLLPAGINEEDLEKIWGENYDELRNILLRYNLLFERPHNGRTLYSLYPFMTAYAEGCLEKQHWEHFSERIRRLLITKAENTFTGLVTNTMDKSSLELFLLEEPNFKACNSRSLTQRVVQDRSKELSLENSRAMSNSQLFSKQFQ